MGYSAWGHKEADITKHTYTHVSYYMLFVFLCFISESIIFSRAIHVAAIGSISFFLMSK